jgi:hypothetical protein
MKHSVARRFSPILLALGLAVSGAIPLPAVELRDVLGVAHAAGKYNFTDEDYLNEGADRILELGSRVIKVFLVPDAITTLYYFNSDWSPPTTDVVELAQRPYFKELLDKPFTTFILVVSPVLDKVRFVDGMTPDEVDVERDQMYRLAKYLLTTYADTGKTFILQNWEGDHLLFDGLPAKGVPDAVRLRGMIDWWRARQDGVDQARREVVPRGVDVAHAAEVNFLREAMQGQVDATNDVLPQIDADLYSYSSWDVGFEPAQMVAALDYLASKAPPSRRFGRRDIYLGEYGMAKDHGAPEGERPDRIRRLMEAAIGWGVRYAVYWEVFDNEASHPYRGRPRNNDLRGFWLIRPDGERAKMWDSLAAQMPAAATRGAFRSFSGQYFSVAENGDRSLHAERWTNDDPWEVFSLKDWNGGDLESGDTVSLQAHDGQYLTVENGSSARVFARASVASRNERFTVRKIGGTGAIKIGDSVAFQTRTGKYLGAEVGKHGLIRALRPAPGPAEVFVFSPAQPEE